MGAEYLFYMTSIETYARAFLALIILPIGTVREDTHSEMFSTHCEAVSFTFAIKTR